MRGRKLWRGLRWSGVVKLLLVVVILILGFKLLSLHQRYGFYLDPFTFVRPVFFVALIGVPIALSWGRYKRSAETKPYQEVLGPLIDSDQEFCLVLRPFGADGEVVLPHGGHGASTIEQVIARAARKSLGLKTYALVDQDRRLAPPGPVYMRAPHDQWQSAVHALIRRAHSIVLILPPGQGIRDALKWEIDQITQHNLQTRLTVVLPPYRLYRDDFSRAFQDACVIAAALQGFAGSIDDVNPLDVLQVERILHERTEILKYGRSKPGETAELRWWFVKGRLGRKGSMRFYRRALMAALGTTERELSGLGFSARYPHSLS